MVEARYVFKREKEDGRADIVMSATDDMTADEVVDVFRRFLLAVEYHPESINNAFSDVAQSAGGTKKPGVVL